MKTLNLMLVSIQHYTNVYGVKIEIRKLKEGVVPRTEISTYFSPERKNYPNLVILVIWTKYIQM
jgi:hypothetical protein